MLPVKCWSNKDKNKFYWIALSFQNSIFQVCLQQIEEKNTKNLTGI